jgi:hypothetical protein
MIKWSRHLTKEDTAAYRLRVSTAFAIMINKAMAGGAFSEAAAETIVAPIFKRPKQGQVSDRTNSSAYRPLAIMNVSLKILALVLLAKVTHWAEWAGHIGSEQCGFQPQRSGEMQVFALKELIKAKLRTSKSAKVCALFCDFASAYDRVSHSALWAVLSKMGMPARLLQTLKNWMTAANATVRLDGEVSDRISISTGLQQGSPLSCVLFNLYLQSACNYLDSIPGIQGVELKLAPPLRSVILKRLLYADDLCILSTSPAGLLLALEHLALWSSAWGMELNFSPGKTEAMFFSTALSPPAPATCPPLSLPNGGGTAYWVDEYIYLGHVVRYDLSDRGAAAKQLDSMLKQYTCYFTCDRTLPHMSSVAQFQVLKVCVLSGAGYLRATIKMSAADHCEFDKLALRAARTILQLPSKTSNALTWCLSGLVPSQAMSDQARWRLYCQLRNPRYDSPAADMLFYLRNEPARTMKRGGGIVKLVQPRARREGELVALAQGAGIHAHSTSRCRRPPHPRRLAGGQDPGASNRLPHA